MQRTYIEFPEQGKVEVKTEELSEDNLAPMEVIVKNLASVMSAGTELAGLYNTEGKTEYPMRPGYGAIGVIEKKGDGVDDFQIGDCVFYASKHASYERFTHGQDHQWGFLFPVPDGLDPVYGTVGCMAQISLTAPNITDLRLGDTVAVFGLGQIGNMAAQMYAMQGARVIGVDPVKSRCEAAQKMGIAETVDVAPDKQVEAVLELTGGDGAEVTVDAVGHSAVVGNCVKATKLFGQIVLLGSPRAPMEGNVTEILRDVHSNGKIIRGAHMWRFPLKDVREAKLSVEWNFKTVFDLIKSGKLKVKELISHVVKPEDVPEAYDGLQNKRDEYTGAIIKWA